MADEIRLSSETLGTLTLMSSEYVDSPEHGEQTAELLDAIEQLLAWLRVGTFDEQDGEREARDRARAVLDRYRRAD